GEACQEAVRLSTSKRSLHRVDCWEITGGSSTADVDILSGIQAYAARSVAACTAKITTKTQGGAISGKFCEEGVGSAYDGGLKGVFRRQVLRLSLAGDISFSEGITVMARPPSSAVP